jgi:hypothetical protein
MKFAGLLKVLASELADLAIVHRGSSDTSYARQ